MIKIVWFGRNHIQLNSNQMTADEFLKMLTSVQKLYEEKLVDQEEWIDLLSENTQALCILLKNFIGYIEEDSLVALKYEDDIEHLITLTNSVLKLLKMDEIECDLRNYEEDDDDI